VTTLALTLGVLLAGGVGSLLRYAADVVLRALWTTSWPVATALVNVLGSGLLGWLTGSAPPGALLVLGVGLCGGFTTLSTASVEVVRLLAERRWGIGLGYLVGQAVVCVAAAAAGLSLGSA